MRRRTPAGHPSEPQCAGSADCNKADESDAGPPLKGRMHGPDEAGHSCMGKGRCRRTWQPPRLQDQNAQEHPQVRPEHLCLHAIPSAGASSSKTFSEAQLDWTCCCTRRSCCSLGFCTPAGDCDPCFLAVPSRLPLGTPASDGCCKHTSSAAMPQDLANARSSYANRHCRSVP